MTKQIYIISGLGADERVFQKLDFAGHSVTFINWIVPDRKDSLASYAQRLSAQIKTHKPILIGISFGGMLAVEMTKHIDVDQLILLASAKTKNEIPFYYRWAGAIGLHHVLPTHFLKQSNFISNYFFGVRSTDDRQLLKSILDDTDAEFLKWAIQAVVRWDNKLVPDSFTHIHGTRDRILPIRFIDQTININNGGHFMTVNCADEVSVSLKKVLAP